MEKICQECKRRQYCQKSNEEKQDCINKYSKWVNNKQSIDDVIAELDRKFEDFIETELHNIDVCWHCEYLACIPETRYEPEEWYCELHLEGHECPKIKEMLVYHFLDSVCEEYEKEVLDEWEKLENGQ